MPLLFGTKAETLAQLAAMDFNVPQSVFFTAAEWNAAPVATMHRARAAINTPARLAVRSSARLEDGGGATFAGAFTSVLNVDGADDIALSNAVTRVLASFDGQPDNQVLIQPMVQNPMLAGVLMTRPLDDGSPYFVVSYDDVSGRTDTITGGIGESKTVYVYRGARESDFDSPRLLALRNLALRLEQTFDTSPLDIEFVMDASERIFVVQVRRMPVQSRWDGAPDGVVDEAILAIEAFLDEYGKERPGVLGERTILGVMPDWNPAEIIGTSPRPLAASLYRELITRRIWSEARHALGYRAVPPEDLMVLVAGQPYIDVRNSFNSFLPDGLDDATGAKLVNAWLDRLDEHPELHDKVEFSVALTSRDFCFDEHLDAWYPGLLTQAERAEFTARLTSLTAACLTVGPDGSLQQSIAAVELLKCRQRAAEPLRPSSGLFGLLAGIRLRLDDCRILGTRPFAVAARHAFIAECLLRSAVIRGALTEDRLAIFKNSIKTVATVLAEDLRNVALGLMSHQEFNEQYGHLRPGTYDITSPCYANRPELLDGLSAAGPGLSEHAAFKLTDAERTALDRLLEDSGFIGISADNLLAHASLAIPAREYCKMTFTRTLSEILEGLAMWGGVLGLTRDDVSFLTMSDVLDLAMQPWSDDVAARYRAATQRRRADYAKARRAKLGYLIRSSRDVRIVPQHRSAPNFVTQQRSAGEIVALDAHSLASVSLTGKIVCIENADPGFDWVFAKGIAGLVTKYGGANSHMAVRCAEHGLPAAIGCGELLFEKVRAAARCEIDGENRTLRAL